MALLVIGRNGERWQGKTYRPYPVNGCSSFRIATACCAEWYNVSLFHLHLFSRDIPLFGFKVNLCPFHLPQLPRTDKQHRCKLQGALDMKRPLETINSP